MLEDLRNGRITAGAALSVYGVVIVDDQVDELATQLTRDDLRHGDATTMH